MSPPRTHTITDRLTQRAEAERQALAEQPVADKNGWRIEVGQIIRWFSKVGGITQAVVTEVKVGFEFRPTGYTDAIRKPDGDRISTESYRVGSSGRVQVGCHALEAEVVTDPEEIAAWEASQVDIRLANLVELEAKLRDRLHEVEVEREELRRRREAQR